MLFLFKKIRMFNYMGRICGGLLYYLLLWRTILVFIPALTILWGKGDDVASSHNLSTIEPCFPEGCLSLSREIDCIDGSNNGLPRSIPFMM